MPEVVDVKKKPRWRVTRRGFLIGVGVSGAGLALGWRYGLPELRLRVARALDNASPPGSIKASPVAWFDISPDNQVTLYMPKVEMGQGIHTALGQIAAEELELDWQQLRVVASHTNQGLADAFGTGGSNTISSLFTPLREAAATLRSMLTSRAAELWGIEAVYAITMNGEVFQQQNPQVRLSYGEIVQGAGAWDVPKEKPELKPVSEFRLIGKPLPRVDFREKLTGRAVYGYDARVPGMLYGAVARPPSLGATLKRASAGTALRVSGVEKVLIEDDFVGVVAQSRTAAWRALEALELDWQESQERIQQDELERLTTVQNGAGVVIQRHGRSKANLTGDLITAEYRTPFAAHAHLEPQAALVDVQANKVTALVSTQSPDLVRNELAKLLGRKNAEVEVTASYLGGGFGRRLNVEVAGEAARLSAAVGKPVHVGWTRQEEFQQGYLRPPTHSVLKASLENGHIKAIEHQQASGDVAFPFFPAVAASVLGADFGAWRGSTIPYEGISHRLVSAQRVKLPVRTGWWRGLGLLANVFATESFMDELAHAAGADPLEFRLLHLDDSPNGRRFKTALQSAAEAAGWGTAPAGRALGIACSTDVNTICAQVAEVSVENRQIRVHKITAAIDPGLIINPDGVKAQTEGSIIMGLSSTFLEKATFKDGRVAADNFDRYPILAMQAAPDIQVIPIESGSEPFGMGEPPMGPVAAAVANAVYQLTGQRLRTLPLELA